MFQYFHTSQAGFFLTFIILFGFAFWGCSKARTRSGIGPGGRTNPGTFFSDSGECALADAAGMGDVEEIDRLVASGVNVNATGKHGMTPLLWAMGVHNHEGFKRLLEKGADPNQQHSEIDIGHGSSAMTLAASYEEDSFYLEQALKHGGNPNLLEPTGNRARPNDMTTPIHRAVDSRCIKNLDLLIDAGADLNHKGGVFGCTPLIDTVCLNWFDGAYRLLEAGADYRIKNDNGSDLADFAVDEGVPLTPECLQWKDKVLEFLEKKGVDLEAARKKAEAKGIRTKRWQPGEIYKPDIKEYRGPQYPGGEKQEK